MPIRTSDLQTRMLRASPRLLLGAALKDLPARGQPAFVVMAAVMAANRIVLISML